MGMKKKLFKAAAYATKPGLTFAANNPGKAAVVKAGQWASKQMMEHVVPERFQPRRRRSTLGMTAAKGLGAAAVAMPLGFWLGKKLMARSGA